MTRRPTEPGKRSRLRAYGIGRACGQWRQTLRTACLSTGRRRQHYPRDPRHQGKLPGPFHKACSSTVKHLVNHLFRGDGVTLGPKASKLRWIARPDEFFICVSVTIRSVEWTLPQKICLFPQIIPPQQDTSSCCARTWKEFSTPGYDKARR
jgi:hypothetical protein